MSYSEDAEHWRANHDEAVRRKRVKDGLNRELRARLTALEQENKRLREVLEKLVSLYEAEFDPEVANRRPDWLRAALTHEDKP